MFANFKKDPLRGITGPRTTVSRKKLQQQQNELQVKDKTLKTGLSDKSNITCTGPLHTQGVTIAAIHKEKDSQEVAKGIEEATGMNVDESCDKRFEITNSTVEDQTEFDRIQAVSQGGTPIPTQPDTPGRIEGKDIDDENRHVIITGKNVHNQRCVGTIDPTESIDILYTLIGEDIYDDNFQCKPTKSGSLLIGLKTTEQVKKLLSLNKFGDYNVKVEVAELVGTVRGVIHEERLMNKTEEYIKNKLSKERVVKVRQIIKTIGENKVTTPLFILTFKLKKLPKTIKLASEIKRVKPYQIRPSQCKKCYRFGHWFESCTKN